MMNEAIEQFSSQFTFEPEIMGGHVGEYRRAIIAGMGGSHLAADLVKMFIPEIEFVIHSDYGLPSLSDEEFASCLFIASSYSGNTEETLDAFTAAKARGLPRAALSVGGALITQAEKELVPYIRLPATGVQPRSALGFMAIALLKLLRKETEISRLAGLAESLDPRAYSDAGAALASRMRGRVPVIYSSRANSAIALNWKIKLNETGKIPAFWNIFPELNHNEMTGFDAVEKTKHLSANFYFILLRDDNDHPRVQKRMELTERLLRDRGFVVETVALEEGDVFRKVFASLLLADWTAFYTAQGYGVEPEQVPMVEEFKKQMA